MPRYTQIKSIWRDINRFIVKLFSYYIFDESQYITLQKHF
jgi:hypothetical protein